MNPNFTLNLQVFLRLAVEASVECETKRTKMSQFGLKINLH